MILSGFIPWEILIYWEYKVGLLIETQYDLNIVGFCPKCKKSENGVSCLFLLFRRQISKIYTFSILLYLKLVIFFKVIYLFTLMIYKKRQKYFYPEIDAVIYSCVLFKSSFFYYSSKLFKWNYFKKIKL